MQHSDLFIDIETYSSVDIKTCGSYKYIESPDFEVLIVNDGSTDNTEKLCLELKEKYSNVVYVKQKNKGASSARNKGLSLATGEYVSFLDADDAWNKARKEANAPSSDENVKTAL
jgi:glycosyltransferase involved in cell wall biosynthesis